jgi:hypothetical protein
LDRSATAVETLVHRGLEVAQNEFHTRPGGDDQ